MLNVIKDTQVSQPFAVGNEWLIIKRMAVKLPEKLDIENYREKIKQILLKDEIEKVIGNLIKDANIKILIPTKNEEKVIELKSQEPSTEPSVEPSVEPSTQEPAIEQNLTTEKSQDQSDEKELETQPANVSSQ